MFIGPFSAAVNSYLIIKANGANACLTAANGSPNGWDFCKCLIRRKVYGLTGKIPPGSLPKASLPGSMFYVPPSTDGGLPITDHPSVKASQTQSNPVKPNPPTSPHLSFTGGKETAKFLAIFDHLVLSVLFLCLISISNAAQPDYASVDTIFTKYCLDCHASKDPEGELVLESFDSLMKGGEIGPAVLPGKSSESLLVKMIEGRSEKDGKKKIMPPGKRAKLTPAEIVTIKSWIDAGALAPSTPLAAKELVLPKIAPKGSPRDPVSILAFAKKGTLIAAGRYGKVDLRCTPHLIKYRTLDGIHGNINAVVFTRDGNRLFTAAGQPGLSGEVQEWNVWETNETHLLIRSFTAHKDAIYAMALSPDDKILATGSYDQKIKLWDAESGKGLRTLSGHNGCIFGIAFRPDGKILASASADRTVKLWDAATGERRDTFSQPLKEVYTVAFTPDGKRLAAGGADNRIRIWEVSDSAAETTNPLLYSKFAHEGAILRLAFSPDGKMLASTADDRTVKLWDAEEMHVRDVLEEQPDWPTALVFTKNSAIVVGRLDGSLKLYDIAEMSQSRK
jgi:WD40 repeat protein